MASFCNFCVSKKWLSEGRGKYFFTKNLECLEFLWCTLHFRIFQATSLRGQFLVAFPHMFRTTMFDPLVFISLVPGVGGIVAHSQTAAYHPTFFMIMAMADKVLADWQIMHTKQGMRFDKEAIFINEKGEAGFCSRTKENSYWGNLMLPPFDRYAVIPSLQVLKILSWIRVGVG